MVKKLLWGCSAFVVLVGIGLAVVVALNWEQIASNIDEANKAVNDESSLSQDLDKEFGGQPQVEFVCRLPVVGIAPCILNSEAGTREVTLTFTNYELPEGVIPEERARQIAILAFKNSELTRESDKTDVIFEEITSSGSASVSRTSRYSFSREELAASVGP